MTIQTSSNFQNPYYEQLSTARSDYNKNQYEALIDSMKSEEQCPYSALAKDGQIEYNGVVFQCDYKTNSITLGDVTSNRKEVLTIPLKQGGQLKVNVHNLEELSHAIGMFSPEDQAEILRAIAQYNFCVKKIEELEEDENSIGDEDPEKEALLSYIGAYKLNLLEKIKNHDNEPTFQIGGQSFTEKEWEHLLKKIDHAEEYLKEELEERMERQQEELLESEQISEEQLEKLLAEY